MHCPPNNSSRLGSMHTAPRGIHDSPTFEISHSTHHVSELQALASYWVLSSRVFYPLQYFSAYRPIPDSAGPNSSKSLTPGVAATPATVKPTHTTGWLTDLQTAGCPWLYQLRVISTVNLG